MKLRFNGKSRVGYRFSPPRLDEKNLEKLKQKEKLGRLISGCKNDYETAKRLCVWASRRITHGQGKTTGADALAVLRDADKGRKLRCVEFSVLLRDSLAAFGIRARVLGLKVKNIETIKSGGGHVVVEAFIRTWKKWVMFDPQAGALATLNGVPLNAVELQRAITDKNRSLKIVGTNKSAYVTFVYKHLFYFDTQLNQKSRIMLVPLGAKKPKIFQRNQLMNGLVYTHSLSAFYRKPN